MATSRFGEVCDALLDLMRAQPGYRGLDGASGVLVLDSTEAWQTDLLVGDYLVIGWTDPDGEDHESGATDQETATLGKVTRDEVGEIRCRAVSQAGAVEPKPARDGALAIAGAVEDVVRADPTLALIPTLFAQVDRSRRRTVDQWLSGGAVCAITFYVNFKTRI